MLKARTILLGLVCIGLAVWLCGCGNQEGSQSGAGNAGGRAAPPKDPSTQTAEPAEEKRVALGGTQWDINVVHTVGANKKITTPDKLRFIGGRVYIEKFKAQGYRSSNYSSRVQSDGTVVWETMQTGRDGSKLFLRGKWRGESMSGVITKRLKKGDESKKFTFVSTAPPIRP